MYLYICIYIYIIANITEVVSRSVTVALSLAASSTRRGSRGQGASAKSSIIMIKKK